MNAGGKVQVQQGRSDCGVWESCWRDGTCGMIKVWGHEACGGKDAGEAQVATPRSSTGNGPHDKKAALCPLGSSSSSATSQPFTLGQAASVLQYLFPPLGGGEGTGGFYATGRNSGNVNMPELDPVGPSKC